MPRTVAPSPNVVPLMRAAAILGRSYHTVLNQVLTRRLTGYQDERGRWWVYLSALRGDGAVVADAPSKAAAAHARPASPAAEPVSAA